MRVRFSDFQVNEIAKDGSVTHLRTVGLQGESNKRQVTQSPGSRGPKPPDEEQQARAEPSVVQVAPEDVALLESLAGQRFAQDLVELFNSGNGPTGDPGRTATSHAFEDKAKRAQLHGQVRRIFNSRLETTTRPDGAIVANFNAPRKGPRKSRGRRGQADDEPVGQYLHFTLYKDNRDTMDAVSQIARLLRVKPQAIGYAGTKDRRASTVQRCSVRYQRKTAMAGLNGKLWGISTGDYQYQDDAIHLGQLLGNEFVITLKNCQMSDQDPSSSPAERLSRLKTNVESALAHMAAHGWINYFGHQRFGTHDLGTHQVGKLILGDDFEGAVHALLQYDPEMASKAEAGEVPEEPSKRDECIRHQACMLFRTGQDLGKAAKIIPRRYAGESCLLRHLTRMGKHSSRDFAGAITHITRGLRSMYLHAYQSYVWNHAASHRFSLHGAAVVKGDLVICDVGSQPLASQREQDQDGDDIINPAEDDEDAPLRARPLTEEEAVSGQYTIHDVVLPSPGYDVIYPDNEVGDFYKEFMGRPENGGLDPLQMRRLRREFSLPGRYRKLMQKFLSSPSVQVSRYADDTEQMHPTDLDLIHGQGQGPDGASKRKNDVDGVDNAEEAVAKKQKVDDGAGVDASVRLAGSENDEVIEAGIPPAAAEEAEPTKIAVLVKFQLASSAYATVALRELMGDQIDEET